MGTMWLACCSRAHAVELEEKAKDADSLAVPSSGSGEQNPSRRRAVWRCGWRGGGGVCTTPLILHLCSESFSFLEVPEGIDCGTEEMQADGQVFLEHQSFLHEEEVLKY